MCGSTHAHQLMHLNVAMTLEIMLLFDYILEIIQRMITPLCVVIDHQNPGSQDFANISRPQYQGHQTEVERHCIRLYYANIIIVL